MASAEEMLQEAARREGEMLATLHHLRERMDRMDRDIEQKIDRVNKQLKTAYGGFTTMLLFIAGLYLKGQGLW